MSGYQQKKIAMINDLSGYGRCSLTVALPILSAMKLQCCPVPTSILSNHTGFPVYFFDDYTEKMEPYLEKWKELGLTFDGIVVGFLGSERQIEIVSHMIRDFKTQNTQVIIDPIMGDHGVRYATFTEEMCARMKELAALGDIVTPNLTEACILTGRTYRADGWSRRELFEMAEDIRAMGPSGVVITGIRQGGFLVNAVAERGNEPCFVRRKRIGTERPGTGDVFSSVTAGACVRGNTLKKAVEQAAGFVQSCIRRSEKLKIPPENGVCFEEILKELIPR